MENKTEEHRKFRQRKVWVEFRGKMLELAGFKCQLHGGKKYTLSRQSMLQCHHLDPDNYEDLRPEKFRILCATCHDDIVEHFSRMILGKDFVPFENFYWFFMWIRDFLPYKAVEKVESVFGLKKEMPFNGEKEKNFMKAPSKDGGKDFAICEEGVTIGRLVQLIDCGTSLNGFTDQKGEPTKSRPLIIGFETGNIINPDTEKPFIVYAEFPSFSMYKGKTGKPSKLRTTMIAAYPGIITEENANDYDFDNLLGKYNQITIEHITSKSGNTFAKVSNISPLMKGITKPDPVHDFVVFDLNSGDFLDKIGLLPVYIKSRIEKSDEWIGKSAGNLDGKAKDGVFEDDIPF